MKKRFKIIGFCTISIAFIGCDQITKGLAKEHLKNHWPLSFYHDTFRLEYVENTGAFMSFGAEWPTLISFWMFNILPLIFLSALLLYTIRKSGQMSLPFLLALALVFSGGIGNTIDRIVFDRHVADFMNVGINNLRTGIFNFADVYVTTGVILLMLNHFKWSKQPNQV